MARTKVQSELIATNAISGTIIADGAITSTHLAANCVDSSELVTGSIDTIHIAANQVTATKIVTNGVLTRHISDDQVTAAKLANSINTDIATGVTANTTANAALPKAGGTMTGALVVTGDANPALEVSRGSANTTNVNLKYNTTLTGQLSAANEKFQISAAGSGTEMEFYVNGTKRLEIDTSGNLGIGLTPKTDWHTGYDAIQIGESSAFFANAAADEIFMVQNARYTSSGWKYNSSGTATLFDMQSGNTRWRRAASGSDDGTISWSDSMFIDTSGNVGIGNLTPSNNHANANRLVVGNGTAGGIANYVGTGTGWYAFSRDNANNTDAYDGGISYNGDRDLKFHTNAGSTRMTIDGAGKVGIGTDSPSEMLHIVGGGSGPEIRLANSSSSHYIRAYNDNWNFLANATNTAMTIKNSGTILTPSQPFFMTNRSAGNQTFAAAAWVDVDWTGEPYDTGGNYTLSSGVFTAPIAGVYLFTGLIGFNTITATNYLLARIVCSSVGDFYITHEQKRSGGGDYGYDAAISTMVSLAASETVKIQVFAGGGGDHSLMSRSNWQGRLLG